MAPIFKQLADDYQEGSIKFVKVDTDLNEDAVDNYNIQGLPLFGIFLNGQMVASHSGALGKEVLRELILSNLKKNSITIP
jgi:thioredoxin 1